MVLPACKTSEPGFQYRLIIRSGPEVPLDSQVSEEAVAQLNLVKNYALVD